MGLFSSIFGGGGSKVKIDMGDVDPFDASGAVGREAQTNRINQMTPFGNLTFSGPNRSNMNFALSPGFQRLLQEQQRFGTQASQVGRGMLSAIPGTGQEATDAIMARLQPQFDMQDRALRERLEQSGNPAAFGSVDMSEGGFNELALQNQGFNDARLAAVMAAPAYQAQLAQTAMGLGNASPIGVPQYQFQGPSPINVGGLELGGYGAQLDAATNAGLQSAQNKQKNRSDILSGLFSLGSAGMGGFGG